MTRQEIYDIVKQHLLTQGVRSQKESSVFGAECAYRGDNGLKCAVGALIPDSLYKPEMEGKRASALMFFNHAVAEYFGVDNGGFLDSLQTVHDSDWIDPKHWPAELERVAREYGVKP